MDKRPTTFAQDTIIFLKDQLLQSQYFSFFANFDKEVGIYRYQFLKFFPFLIDKIPDILESAFSRKTHSSLLWKDLNRYITTLSDGNSDNFVNIFLPVGFDKNDPTHVEWATNSFQKQITDSIRIFITCNLARPESRTAVLDWITKVRPNIPKELTFFELLKNLGFNEDSNLYAEFMKLPGQLRVMITTFLTDAVDFIGSKIIGLGNVELIAQSYLQIFEYTLNYFLKPLIFYKNPSINPSSINSLTVNEIIDKATSYLPKELKDYLNKLLVPKLRNAIAHKNYLINKDNNLSYFRPPYRNIPLKFDQIETIDDLWAKTFFLNHLVLLLTITKLSSAMKLLTETTQDDDIAIALWTPESFFNKKVETGIAQIDYFLSLPLFKMFSFHKGTVIAEQTIENYCLELLLHMSQKMPLVSKDNKDKTFTIEEIAKMFWLSAGKNLTINQNKILFGYFLYLLSIVPDPNRYLCFVTEFKNIFQTDENLLRSIENEIALILTRANVDIRTLLDTDIYEKLIQSLKNDSEGNNYDQYYTTRSLSYYQVIKATSGFL